MLSLNTSVSVVSCDMLSAVCKVKGAVAEDVINPHAFAKEDWDLVAWTGTTTAVGTGVLLSLELLKDLGADVPFFTRWKSKSVKEFTKHSYDYMWLRENRLRFHSFFSNKCFLFLGYTFCTSNGVTCSKGLWIWEARSKWLMALLQIWREED